MNAMVRSHVSGWAGLVVLKRFRAGLSSRASCFLSSIIHVLEA